MMTEIERHGITAAAACLRSLARQQRYRRYADGISRGADALMLAVDTSRREKALDAYTALQSLCRRDDALDAEIHRSVLHCLGHAITLIHETD